MFVESPLKCMVSLPFFNRALRLKISEVVRSVENGSTRKESRTGIDLKIRVHLHVEKKQDSSKSCRLTQNAETYCLMSFSKFQFPSGNTQTQNKMVSRRAASTR